MSWGGGQVSSVYSWDRPRVSSVQFSRSACACVCIVPRKHQEKNLLQAPLFFLRLLTLL